MSELINQGTFQPGRVSYYEPHLFYNVEHLFDAEQRQLLIKKVMEEYDSTDWHWWVDKLDSSSSWRRERVNGISFEEAMQYVTGTAHFGLCLRKAYDAPHGQICVRTMQGNPDYYFWLNFSKEVLDKITKELKIELR
jgi:hypothetical protein